MGPIVALALGLVAVTATPYVCYLGLYVWVRPEGSPAAADPSAEPTVSVLLPTYNEADIVESRLEALLALDYPADRLEVVVVDSSEDDTAERVRTFFADREAPTLTFVEEEDRGGVARAVNRGVEAATGEVVFRTDCDSRLAADAVRRAVAVLADPEVAAVTGRQADVLGDSETEQEYRNLLARLQAMESHLDSTFICHGPCFAFERAAFSGIAADSLADDTEIGVRVRRGGHRVVMDPAVRFAEAGVSAFRERRHRKDRRATGLIQLLIRHRDALGRYGRYGRVVLPFNAYFMIAGPWLAVLTGLAALGAAVSVTGLFGLAALPAAAVGGWLGARDLLGPLQPLYAVADAQVSLLVAQARLGFGDATGTWEVDRDSRQVFE